MKNSDDFFQDMIYNVAREYYIHPISKDYAYSESMSFEDEDYAIVRSEYANDLLYAHINEYVDDYIEEPDFDKYHTSSISSSDYDFDLLELEIDELMESGALDEDIEEFRTADEADFLDDNLDQIDVDSIPQEILGDPVKLLEWLSEQERIESTVEDESDDSW